MVNRILIDLDSLQDVEWQVIAGVHYEISVSEALAGCVEADLYEPESDTRRCVVEVSASW